LIADCRRQIDEAGEAYLADEVDDPTEIFAHQFAALPTELERQQHILLRSKDRSDA